MDITTTKGTLCRDRFGGNEIYVKWDVPSEVLVPLVRINKVVLPQKGESEGSFRHEYDGHGLFISGNLEKRFHNWDKFPELHEEAIIFLDADCYQGLGDYNL